MTNWYKIVSMSENYTFHYYWLPFQGVLLLELWFFTFLIPSCSNLRILFLHVRIYESYSFMFESTKLKGRRSLMLSKQ